MEDGEGRRGREEESEEEQKIRGNGSRKAKLPVSVSDETREEEEGKKDARGGCKEGAGEEDEKPAQEVGRHEETGPARFQVQ
eukprot:155859-Hanusia_phi.AAC.1